MAIIAPWLIPADAVGSAAKGAQLGIDVRGQDIQANEHAASLAQAAQEAQAQQQLEQQKITGGLAEAKARTELETQAAARKFQAQRGYQMALDSGEEPVNALLRFGPQMGASTSGLGQIMLENFRQKQAASIPQPFMDPDTGKIAGWQLGNTIHMSPAGKAAKATVPPGLAEQMKAAQAVLKSAVMPEQIKSAKAEVDKLAEEMNKAVESDGGENNDFESGGKPATAPGPAYDFEYDPKAGTFNQVGQ